MKNKKSNKNIYPYVVGVIPLSEIGKLPGTPIGHPAYIDYDELYEAVRLCVGLSCVRRNLR